MASRASLAGWLLRLLTVYVVTAIAFNAFYQRWGFDDDDVRMGLVEVLDGTAYRPFVYRRLLPDIANAVDARISEPLRSRLTRTLATHAAERMPKSSDAIAQPRYSIRFHLIYGLTFLSAFAAFWSAFLFAKTAVADDSMAFAAAAITMLCLPLLQEGGGHYYDFAELAFFCLFAAQALRAGGSASLLMIPTAAIATWNKESFLFFIPAVFPLLVGRLGARRSLALLALCIAASGSVDLIEKVRFAGTPGANGEFHLFDQIAYFLPFGPFRHLSGLPAGAPTLLSHRQIYGVALLPGSTPLIVIAAAIPLVSSWRRLRKPLRQFTLFAACINLPLFFLFCSPGELRNLSMLLPAALAGLACFLGFRLREARADPGEDRWSAGPERESVRGSMSR